MIFAWKSEQEKVRIRPDYELKTERASVVGKTFGKFLEQFSDRNVLLSGFSLGSQVVLTGLTNCESGGANLPGRYQVALIAPALDPKFVCGSLNTLPNVGLIQRTEVVANEKDIVIKAAQKMAAKICREWLPEFKRLARTSEFANNPIRVRDIGDDISRQHSTNNYYGSTEVQRLHREMLKQVYAIQQPHSVPAVMVEPDAVSVLGESDSVLDFQPALPASDLPVLAAPTELVPSIHSN